MIELDDVLDVEDIRMTLGFDADTGARRLVLQFEAGVADGEPTVVTVGIPLELAIDRLSAARDRVARALDPDLADLVREVVAAPFVNTVDNPIGARR
jgi:hypothetical protein